MPSSKAPATTVQPGPGIAPDGSVTATALNFNPASGSAAVAAHVSDPVRAHIASAIGAGPYNSTKVWGVGSTTADGAFVEAFNGLAARAVVVLDANSSALDADYAGPNALITAIAALPSARSPVLYLRPGRYAWDNSVEFAGVTIIGAGSPTYAAEAADVASNNYVEIRNSANIGGFRFTNGVTVRNVMLTTTFAGGTMTLSSPVTGSTGGNCTFENVHFRILGKNLTVASSHNVFRQCVTHSSSTTGTYLIDSGSQNLYESCSFDQIWLSAAGGGNNVFSAVKVLRQGTDGAGAGALTPNSTFPLVSVASSSNVFNSLSIGGGTAISLTSNVLFVSASYNAFKGLSLSNFTCSKEAVLLDGSGCYGNTFDNTYVSGVACTGIASSGMIRLNCVDTVFSNLRVASSTVSGTTNAVLHFSCVFVPLAPALPGNNTVNNLSVLATTTGAGTIVSYEGIGNKVLGVNIASVGRNATVHFLSTAQACVFRNAYIGGFAASASTVSFIRLEGNNNVVEGVEFQNISAVNNSLVRFNGTGCKATGLRISNVATPVGSTTHILFCIVLFYLSTNCLAGDVEVTSCTGMNTVSSASNTGLVLFIGSKACTLDGLLLSNVGTAGTNTTITSIVYGATTKNLRCVVRNVVADTTTKFEQTYSWAPISINQQWWDGLTLEGIRLDVAITNSPCISLFNTAAAAGVPALPDNGPTLPTRVTDCTFLNTASTGASGVSISGSGGGFPRFIFSGCHFSASSGASVADIAFPTTSPVWSGLFTDCWFQVLGTDVTRAVTCRSGVKFVRCTFVGSSTTGTGSVGVQLFSGYGTTSAGSAVPLPMVLEDCHMLLGTRNFDDINASRPQVFLGGSDNSAGGGHGPVVVRGLIIQADPRVTSDISFWHRSPTLCIDNESQCLGASSTYEDILIDLEGKSFHAPGVIITGTGPAWVYGASVSALRPISNRSQGAVVEISGPFPGTGSNPAVRSSINGLKVVRVPRQSGELTGQASRRAIVVARSVSLENITIDAEDGPRSIGYGYGAAALSVENCTVNNVNLWPTTSIPIHGDGTGGGTNIFYKTHIDAQYSELSGVKIDNLSQGAESNGIIYLYYSSLTNSRISLPDGTHLVNDAGAIVWAAGSVVANSKIAFTHHGGHSHDNRQAIYAEAITVDSGVQGSKILNNVLINRAVQTINYGYGYGPSRGGGCRIVLSGSEHLVMGNSITNHFNTGPDVNPQIELVSGDRCRILNNYIKNLAVSNVAVTGPGPGGGGTAAIKIQTGGYHNVSGNSMVADNSTGLDRVVIDLTGAGATVVMGNQLKNFAGWSSSIIPAGNFRPTTPADFNYLT